MANVFLESDEIFPIGARADVFGRSGGNEGVAIEAGVEDVTLDANLERIHLAQNANALSFQVTGEGLEIRYDGSTVASLTSLNQDADLRFADGNVTLRQTGATTFQVEGADGGTQTLDTQRRGLDVTLGERESRTGEEGDSGSCGDGPNEISGDVLVDGSSTDNLPSSASTLTIGASGSGSAELADNQARTFTSDSFDNVDVAAGSGSSGSLNLSGADTDIVTAGTDNTVQIGRRGDGDLTVENGAEISTLQFEVGRHGNGSATIRGSDSKVTASNDNGLFSGEYSFGSGFVRVARKPDSEGSLEILDGGELEIRPGADQNSDTSGPGLSIGEEVGSNGDVTVDGQGSEIDIRQDSQIQDFGPFLFVGEGPGLFSFVREVSVGA